MFDENISILIPYKGDGGYRDKNFSWIKKRYNALMPNAELCIGSYDDEPFCKSIAINKAAKLATKNIFLIADIDIVFDISDIARGILQLCNYPWVIPYTTIKYLSLNETYKLQQMNPNIDIKNLNITDYYSIKHLCGGINIVPRDCFEKVGGFDERFKGWGCEDDAFTLRLNALCGHPGRINTSLLHMYHPDAPRNNFKRNQHLLKQFYKLNV